jgi:hypothetical protein
MSDYTIAVNWSGKDALSDSDAAKVISGSDFNTEFTTVRTAINSKQDINGDSSEDFAMNNGTVAGTLTVTGVPTIPTASAGTNTTQAASTAFVDTSFAKKASPTFTGTPTAPTASAGTNTTQIATTAFVETATPNASQTVFGMAKIWTSGGDLYIATS